MAQFSTDVDLLKWEPVLFRDLALPGQTLCSGSDGAVSGTTLQSAGASFTTAGVAAGHVVYLYDAGGGVDGCYEVVSVDADTALTISVVRAGADDAAVAPPGGSGLSYRISTFDPQAQEVAESLLQYFGVGLPGSGAAVTAAAILDEGVLRQAALFAVLSAIFAGSAAGEADKENFWQKSLHYQRLFQEARIKVRLGIDADGDATAEQWRCGGAVRLRRA